MFRGSSIKPAPGQNSQTPVFVISVSADRDSILRQQFSGIRTIGYKLMAAKHGPREMVRQHRYAVRKFRRRIDVI